MASSLPTLTAPRPSGAGGPRPGCRTPGGASHRQSRGAQSPPSFTEMMSLDISDSSQIYAAFLVYLDLLEGRNWHEVKHVGVAELQLICLHAREKELDSLQVMVPVPVDISLSHERLREIMKKASLPCDNPDTPLSVTLAIVESDSTVVYYKMTDGFVIPEPPDNTEDVGNKHWKKKRRKLSK
uniref:tRNA splicing endonuclease subunit 15 n=1 Tax=Anas platyrhynchos TaxID=8839 RepID=A0A8B9SNY8_ANAPL